MIDRPNLIGDIRLLVNGVRRPEEKRLYSQLAGEQPFRNVELNVDVTL